jgi:hypothetical protein
VCSRSTSKNSIFVLQAHQIDIAEIQKVGGLAVGSQIVLGQLEPHSGGIAIALLSIVHGESQQLGRAVFRVNGVAQVCREGRNSALSREIVPDHCDSIGKSWTLRYGYRRGRRGFQVERFLFNQ